MVEGGDGGRRVAGWCERVAVKGRRILGELQSRRRHGGRDEDGGRLDAARPSTPPAHNGKRSGRAAARTPPSTLHRGFLDFDSSGDLAGDANPFGAEQASRTDPVLRRPAARRAKWGYAQLLPQLLSSKLCFRLGGLLVLGQILVPRALQSPKSVSAPSTPAKELTITPRPPSLETNAVPW